MTTKTPPPCKEKCLEEMRAELVLTGTIDLPQYYKKYPEVSKASVWKWARSVREREPMPSEVRDAIHKIEERLEAGAPGVDSIPYVSPAIVARGGDEALRQMDYAHELRILWADAHKLRQFGIRAAQGVEPEGADLENPANYRIHNAVVFEKSMKVRVGLMEASMVMLGKVLDMRVLQLFYEAIVQEISKESPEVQRRVFDRMDVINRRYGMTMSMRV